MKQVTIRSKTIPSNPRSGNYPAGSVISGGGGGNTTITGGGGSGVDIVKQSDSKSFTDSNVLSSLRTMLEIRSRILAEADVVTEPTDDNMLSSLRAVAEIDKAIQKALAYVEKTYLNKTKDDKAAGSYEFAKDITVGQLAKMLDLEVTQLATIAQAVVGMISSPVFIDGFVGEGYKIWKDIASGDWTMTLDRITVRKVMAVYELLIQRVRSVGGSMVMSQADGKIKTVEQVGSNYILTFEIGNTFQPNDLLRHQVFTGDSVKYYWVEVAYISGDTVAVPVSEFGDVAPTVGDEVVQMGNTRDTGRQSLIMMSAIEDGKPKIDLLDGVNSKSFEGKLKTRIGWIGDITDTHFPADKQPSGYGVYTNSLFARGAVIILKNGKDLETQFSVIDGEILAAINTSAQYTDGEVGKVNTELKLIPGKITIAVSESLKNAKSYTDSEVKVVKDAISLKVSQKSFNELTNTVSTAVSQIEANTQGLTLTASAAAVSGINERLKEAEIKIQPDNIWLGVKERLQVGGRNYYRRNSRIIALHGSPTILQNDPRTPNGIHVTGDSSGGSAMRIVGVIDSNGPWTVSFDIKGSQSAELYAFNVNICDVGHLAPITTSDNQWRHHSLTVNVTNYSSDVYNFVDFENIAWAYIHIANLKIEKGSVETDWTPAPEDVSTKQELLDTGINIANQSIVLTANRTLFRDNSGNEIAMFENGKIKANLIDVGQLTAKKVETASNGKRIVIDPNSNVIQMFDTLNRLCLSASFFEEGGGYTTSSPTLTMYGYANTNSGYVNITTLTPRSLNIEHTAALSGTGYPQSLTLDPINGLRFLRNYSVVKAYPRQ